MRQLPRQNAWSTGTYIPLCQTQNVASSLTGLWEVVEDTRESVLMVPCLTPEYVHVHSPYTVQLKLFIVLILLHFYVSKSFIIVITDD